MSRKRFDIAMQQQELFERDCHVCICGNSIYAHGTLSWLPSDTAEETLAGKYGEAHNPSSR